MNTYIAFSSCPLFLCNVTCFFPYFASVSTLSTLHCVSCLLLHVSASTVPLAFLWSLCVSSSFLLLPLSFSLPSSPHYMYLLPYPLFSLPLHVCIATSSLLTSKECGSLSTLDCHLCFCLFTLHTEYPVCVVLQCSAEFTWPWWTRAFHDRSFRSFMGKKIYIFNFLHNGKECSHTCTCRH